MFDILVITILLIAIIGVIIYIEYKKANKPQEKTYKTYKTRKSVFSESLKEKDPNKSDVEKTPSTKNTAQPAIKPLKKSLDETKSREEKTVTPITDLSKKEEKTISTVVPEANYSKFNHSRLLEMGLSKDEVQELISELIAQIDTQLPLIQKTIDPLDITAMGEHLHYIKGSATNLGSGGISDLLIDFYSYIQKDKEVEIIQAYFKHLKSYYKELKEQY